MLIIAYLASLLIGVSLGLLGSGGSVLTVPVLVYLFSVDAVAATAYSLFIVGLTSAIGAIKYLRAGLVNLKTAVIFGIPAIVAVYVTRAFILPAIPNELFTIGDFVLSKSVFLLLLFALLMLFSSIGILKQGSEKEKETEKEDGNVAQKFNYPLILLEGSVLGIITGLVGAGGGFLIIPALVLFSRLPMKEAVGTSLLIIAAKSLIGFTGESSETIIDWQLLLSVSALAIIGLFLGVLMSKKIEESKLKPIFAVFIFLMGIAILVKELIFN